MSEATKHGDNMEKRIQLECRGRQPSKVEELNLDNCKATRVEGLTKDFINLESLSLINVGLTTLKGFPKLPNLRKLELSDNRLSSSLGALKKCRNLRNLNLSGNRIRDVETLKPLLPLTDLKVLHLFNCEVTSEGAYRESVFELLPNLTYLDGFDREDTEMSEESDYEADETDESDEDLNDLCERALLSRATDSPTDEKAGVTCGYCLEGFRDMTDPRELPCEHVFCLPCLKDDAGRGGQVITSHTCISCRQTFELANLDSLPAPATQGTKLINKKKATDSAFPCDRCDDKPRQAVRFCVDCGNSVCSKHLKLHDGFFGKEHETVDIVEYAKNSKEYMKKVTCVNHTKEIITMACERCYFYNCVKCHSEKNEKPCKDSQAHTYQPLEKIGEELKEHFENLRNELSDKLEEMSGLEKDALRDMEQMGDDCQEMIVKVKDMTEKQMELIKKQSADIIERIQTYQTEKTDSTVAFVTELASKEEQIEEVRVSTHKFVRDSSVSELIEQKEEKTDLLTETINMSLGKSERMRHELQLGGPKNLDIKFLIDDEVKVRSVVSGRSGTGLLMTDDDD